jgi:hypothetical protein
MHESAALEPRQRRVDCPDRDVAPGVLGELTPDGHPVGPVAKPHDGQKKEVLEPPEMITTHCYFFVVKIAMSVNFNIGPYLQHSAFSPQHFFYGLRPSGKTSSFAFCCA